MAARFNTVGRQVGGAAGTGTDARTRSRGGAGRRARAPRGSPSIDRGGPLCYLLQRVVKKINKKELKRPDQFVSFWTTFWVDAARFASSRKRSLIIGASALATVIVGSIVFSEISERRAIRASDALDRVERIASAELLTADAPAAAAAAGIPRFKTDKERIEGSLAELDASQVAEKGGPLRGEALLLRGGFLLDLDRADEARAVYERALAGGKLDRRLRFLAGEGLGYAYERKGDLDRAAAAFDKLGDDAASQGQGQGQGQGQEGFYRDRAGYHKARLAEIRGNRDVAARLYHEVLDKNPTTSLRAEITNRLALLELK
jgi:tetratricopeptide (TPR) repeat protein